MSDKRLSGTLTIDGVDYAVVGTAQAKTSVAAEIRAAALAAPGPPWPLPLAGSWCTGTLPNSFSPAWQLAQIDAGRHLYPWFQFPEPLQTPSPQATAYYKAALESCRSQGLPIALVGTQWEQVLYQDAAIVGLPPAENPNVVMEGGAIRPQLSPFGATAPWYEVGQRWTKAALFQQLMDWYPDPPQVLLLSNNEAQKLPWTAATDDVRCPSGFTAEEKRECFGEGWASRYLVMQNGMRAGLTPAWAKVLRFRAYNAFGPSFMGRWPAWNDYALACRGRIAPDPMFWDGGAPPYYTSPGTGIRDDLVMSPQIEAMNWVPMQGDASALNPGFDVELSVWDGDVEQRAAYTSIGQLYTPDRYGGYVQWGMWLMRPRLVRDFRYYNTTLAVSEPYFQAVAAAVDRVHTNPTLKRFWAGGQLVANPAALHPYQSALMAEQKSWTRWYGLDTSVDPPRPWTLQTPLPVRALALVMGEAPVREWLLYAHSPLGDRTGVKVLLPGVRSVALDVPVAGRFWRVDEASGTVKVV